MTTQYQDLWINSFLSPFGFDKFTELIPESMKSIDTIISSWQEAYETGVFAPPANLFSPGATAVKEVQDTISGYFKLAGLVPLSEHLTVLERADALQKQNLNREVNEKEFEEKLLELNAVIQKSSKSIETQKKEISKQKKEIDSLKKEIAKQKATLEAQQQELAEQKSLNETQQKQLEEQAGTIQALEAASQKPAASPKP